MFVDETIIKVKAGDGGTGAITFFPGYKTGPSGGNGGDGGNVYVQGDKNLADLHRYAGVTKYSAPNGEKGENFNRNGKDGEDLILRMPIGTLIIDDHKNILAEVLDTKTTHLLAHGGKGGKGNAHFASSIQQAPRYSEPGEEGQQYNLRLVLRLIADFGLIGLPNAGKSSLLNELTSAKVKTAMYPFTTLEPNLGVFDESIIADIPGLIEGASHGKGLGIKFLRHVEKVPVLLHCIAADAPDVVNNYHTINNEMGAYNKELLDKPQTILLTKTDLVDEKSIKSKITQLKKFQKNVLPVSIFNPDQFSKLQKQLRTMSSRE